MSRDSDRGGRIAPVRAVFQDVAPLPTRVPAWMNSTKQKRSHSSPPAAEFRRSRASSGSAQQPSSPPPSSGHFSSPLEHTPSRPPSTDELLYDEQLKSASLTAEIRDSWRPSAPLVDEHAGTEEALEHVHAALVALDAERSALFAQAEKSLLSLVRVVAERVIERTIEGDDQLALRLIREGIGTLEDTSQLIVLLGPGFSTGVDALKSALERDGTRAEIQLDLSAPRFLCKIRSGFGSVDESLETRLDALLSELDPDTNGY